MNKCKEDVRCGGFELMISSATCFKYTYGVVGNRYPVQTDAGYVSGGMYNFIGNMNYT